VYLTRKPKPPDSRGRIWDWALLSGGTWVPLREGPWNLGVGGAPGTGGLWVPLGPGVRPPEPP